MTTKSSRLMNKLWNATEAIPECFGVVLNTLGNFNLTSNINYEANDTNEYSNDEDEDNYNNYDNNNDEDNDNDDNNYYVSEPDVVREVSFTLKKLEDGTLKLVMNFSDEHQSISLNATTKHREITKLESSGIQPSTIDNGWE